MSSSQFPKIVYPERMPPPKERTEGQQKAVHAVHDAFDEFYFMLDKAVMDRGQCTQAEILQALRHFSTDAYDGYIEWLEENDELEPENDPVRRG